MKSYSMARCIPAAVIYRFSVNEWAGIWPLDLFTLSEKFITGKSLTAWMQGLLRCLHLNFYWLVNE